MSAYKIAWLPGDGVGREVMEAARIAVRVAAHLRALGHDVHVIGLYDELEKDIRRAFTSIHQAVGKVQIRFPDSQLHQDIAKSVAVLQILGNLPVSVQNVASLMHDSVSGASQAAAIDQAIEELRRQERVGDGGERLAVQPRIQPPVWRTAQTRHDHAAWPQPKHAHLKGGALAAQALRR